MTFPKTQWSKDWKNSQKVWMPIVKLLFSMLREPLKNVKSMNVPSQIAVFKPCKRWKTEKPWMSLAKATCSSLLEAFWKPKKAQTCWKNTCLFTYLGSEFALKYDNSLEKQKLKHASVVQCLFRLFSGFSDLFSGMFRFVSDWVQFFSEMIRLFKTREKHGRKNGKLLKNNRRNWKTNRTTNKKQKSTGRKTEKTQNKTETNNKTNRKTACQTLKKQRNKTET